MFTGIGHLDFGYAGSSKVVYSLNSDLVGRVNHAEGHPWWHPLTGSGPFQLTMADGKTLFLLVWNEEGYCFSPQ